MRSPSMRIPVNGSRTQHHAQITTEPARRLMTKGGIVAPISTSASSGKRPKKNVAGPSLLALSARACSRIDLARSPFLTS